jgi:BTB/POZ domain
MSFWSSGKKNKKTMANASSPAAKRTSSSQSTNDTTSSPTIQEPSLKKPKGDGEKAKGYASPSFAPPPMSAIDMDSDSEPPQTLSVLDWRMDPNDSFADWTMEIAIQGQPERGVVQKYHVHRSMLMVASPWFRELFGRHGHRAPSSLFDFPTKAVDAFEEFLDYVYQLEDLKLTTANATALYYLGRAFGVERLRWEAKQFWLGDISFETAATYYADAIVFEEESLALAVRKTCADDAVFLRITKDSDILDVADIPLMMYLVESKGTAEHSIHMSELVAFFCFLHGIDYTDDSFVKLTSKLPEISFEAASTFLALENPRYEQDMSALQKRCAQAIAKDWKKFDMSSESWNSCFQNVSPALLVEILHGALVAAQAQAGVHHGADVVVDAGVHHGADIAATATNRVEFTIKAAAVLEDDHSDDGFGAASSVDDDDEEHALEAAAIY